MSERGLGPLACLITDWLTYLFIYGKLFSGDSSSAGNTMFFFLKFVQKSSIWQERTMSKLPFAKDNRECERGWAVTFIFVHMCWLDLRGLFGLQLSVIASVEHFLIYFQFLEGCFIFYHLLFFTHFTRGNASLRSLRSLRAPVLFRGSPERPNASLKNVQCSRSVYNLHFDFQPRALSFFYVIFLSLQPPYNFPVPECAACWEFQFCGEWAVLVRLQNLPRDCPRLVRPGHRSQRLDWGVDQWGLCNLFGGHYLGQSTKGTVEWSLPDRSTLQLLFKVSQMK